jgi:hypothetical protein
MGATRVPAGVPNHNFNQGAQAVAPDDFLGVLVGVG